MGGSRYERVQRSVYPAVDNVDTEEQLARATAVARPEATAPAAAAPGAAALEGGRGPSLQLLVRLLPKLCVVAADILAVSCAMLISFWLRSFVPGTEGDTVHARHLTVAVVSLPLWGICFSRYRLYRARNVASRYDEFVRISHAVFAGVLAMAVVGFLLKDFVSRSWLVLIVPVAIALVAFERAVARIGFATLRKHGHLVRRVVVVGANDEGLAIASMIAADPTLGFHLIGFVDDVVPRGKVLGGSALVLGPVDRLVEILPQMRASSVIIATTSVDATTSNRLARMLSELGVSVELSSSLCDISVQRLVVRPLGRYPLVHIEPISRLGWRVAAKRSFDVVVAGIGLALAAPIMLIAAIAARVDSHGPLLHRQTRMGRDGVPFQLLKFRTMVSNAEELLIDLRTQNEADGPLFKIRHDPRVTRVGRVLRRMSIDELPQLWNVLRGEMTLVGPRPALPNEVEGWPPELHQRLRVRPGITGMWQVSGRSGWSFDDYARLDLYYVDNWSLLIDLAVLFRTVPAVILGRGAY